MTTRVARFAILLGAIRNTPHKLRIRMGIKDMIFFSNQYLLFAFLPKSYEFFYAKC
jgi:hypothetical protein